MKEGSLLSALSSARINAMVSSVETLHLRVMFVKFLNFSTLLKFIYLYSHYYRVKLNIFLVVFPVEFR